jgi:hypothetical protein
MSSRYLFDGQTIWKEKLSKLSCKLTHAKKAHFSFQLGNRKSVPQFIASFQGWDIIMSLLSN